MKKVISVVNIGCCILILLTGCSRNVNKSVLTTAYTACSDTGTPITVSGSYARSGDLELYVNTERYDFTVRNTVTGAEFSSVPADKLTKTLNNEDYLQEARSQLILKYIDKDKVTHTYNTYNDCVAYKQIKAYQIKNGVRMTYTFGQADTRMIIPEIITATELKRVLDNMEDNRLQKRIKSSYKELSSESLKKYDYDAYVKKYPLLAQETLYELRPTTGRKNLVSFEKEFIRQGYTLNGLDRLYGKIGYKADSKSEAVFVIPVDYILTDKGLNVHVYVNKIKEPKGYSLVSLTVLPMFGCAINMDGYFLIPDGSGAVLPFAKTKTLQYYNAAVYGEDLAVKNNSAWSDSTAETYMPIWGIKDKNKSLFAVISKGDAVATVTANTAASEYIFQKCYATFSLRTEDFLAYEGKGRESGTYVYSKDILSEDVEIQYTMLNGPNNTYTDMAAIYRKYLQKNHLLPDKRIEKSNQTLVEVLGYYKKKTSFMGIPYSKKVKLSVSDDIKAITDAFLSEGTSDLQVMLRGWCNGGVYNDNLSRIDTPKNNLSKLSAGINDRVNLLMGIDESYMYGDGWADGFSSSSDAARYLTKQMVSFQPLSVVTKKKLDEFSDFGRYLLNPAAKSRWLQTVSKELPCINKAMGAGLYNIRLSGDYREKNEVDRAQALRMLCKDEDTLANSLSSVAVDTALAPLLGNDILITNFPCESSHSKMESYSVPFYGMVIHGYQLYTAAPINEADDRQIALLRMLESGAGMSIIAMGADSGEILNTPLRNYYNLEYKHYKDEVLKLYRQALPVMAACKGACITSHIVNDDNTVLVGYDNGMELFLNFSDHTAFYRGSKVDKKSFAWSKN